MGVVNDVNLGGGDDVNLCGGNDVNEKESDLALVYVPQRGMGW